MNKQYYFDTTGFALQSLIITGEGVKLHFNLNNPSADHKPTCDEPMHDDLRNLLVRLKEHLAYSCELVEIPERFRTMDEETQKGFFIDGIFRKKEGWIISGSRLLQNSMMMDIKSPAITCGEKKYLHDSHLGELIVEIENEVEEYLKGKFGEHEQRQLDFPDDSADFTVSVNGGEQMDGNVFAKKLKAVGGRKGKRKAEAVTEETPE